MLAAAFICSLLHANTITEETIKQSQYCNTYHSDLHMAIMDNNVEQVQILAKDSAPCVLSHEFISMFEAPTLSQSKFCAKFGPEERINKIKILEILLQNGVDPNIPIYRYPGTVIETQTSTLFQAISHGDIEVTSLLLKYKADANKRFVEYGDKTPLMVAVGNRQPQVVKLLLEHGAAKSLLEEDDSGKNAWIIASTPLKLYTPWIFAENAYSECDHSQEVEEIKQLLLEAAASEGISKKQLQGSFTDLIIAVMSNDAEKATELINAGVGLNEADKFGHTALMHAVKNPEILQFLIDAGADLNKTGNCQETALGQAIYASNVESVKKLVQAGANVNKLAGMRYRNPEDCSTPELPLNLVIYMFDTPEVFELIEIFIQAGSEIVAQRSESYTHLDTSALKPYSDKEKDIAILEFILEKANLEQNIEHLIEALQYACDHKKNTIHPLIKALKSLNGKVQILENGDVYIDGEYHMDFCEYRHNNSCRELEIFVQAAGGSL